MTRQRKNSSKKPLSPSSSRYKLGKDSLSSLIVQLRGEKPRQYYSIDWQAGRYEAAIGYKRFEKWLFSSKMLGKWAWAYVQERSGRKLHYYLPHKLGERLDSEDYKAALCCVDRYNISLVPNRAARLTGQTSIHNIYSVFQEDIPTYYDPSWVYQINVYTQGKGSRLVAKYTAEQLIWL